MKLPKKKLENLSVHGRVLQSWIIKDRIEGWRLNLCLRIGTGFVCMYVCVRSIALRVSGALKPHHHDKVEIPLVGRDRF
jgi:hypothetical protein